MIAEVFTSSWFWLLAIAYSGARFGKYLASKDPDYGFIGLFAWLVSIADYVFIVLLFWKLPKWYLPLFVFAAVFLIDILLVGLHGIISRGAPSLGGLRVTGITGTIVGVVAIILAYMQLL